MSVNTSKLKILIDAIAGVARASKFFFEQEGLDTDELPPFADELYDLVMSCANLPEMDCDPAGCQYNLIDGSVGFCKHLKNDECYCDDWVYDMINDAVLGNVSSAEAAQEIASFSDNADAEYPRLKHRHNCQKYCDEYR